MNKTRFLFVVILLSASWGAHGADIYVPDNHPTIQDAISVSVDGDMVIVRPGTYVENIDFLGKAITVKSLEGPEVTVIDGNQSGSVVTFKNGEKPDTILEGFTITNGSGTVDGMYTVGGGIYCDFSSPTITGSIISGNRAPDNGGAIYCYWSDAIIRNNLIIGNGTINQYGKGGAIYCYDLRPKLLNNIIVGNKTRFRGGAVYFKSCSPGAVIINNTISKNSADTEGGGIYFTSCSPTISNSIIWENSAPAGPEIHLRSSNPVVTYCDVQGGWTGTGNIDADPLFVDPEHDDFHLTYNSPCMNAGDNNEVPSALLRDFEGDRRITDITVDMGADEFHTHLYSLGSVLPGNRISIRVIGAPAATVLLAQGSGIQDPPLQTACGPCFLQLPVVFQRRIGTISADGSLEKIVFIPPSWQPGESYPFQALVGPFAPGSEFTNLLVLHVE